MSFNDIIGQEIPKKILCSQIRHQRVATSYLFYGPPGVGKTLTAKTFAKAINCEIPDKEDSCDRCQTCKEIDAYRNPDFELITPEKSIGIDQIREIKIRDSYRPTWLKFRVTIIREADTLTEEAANSFLKILEEAPLRTIFILTTSKLSAILPTIISRCQPIKFRRLNTQEIEKLVPGLPEPISRLANGSITRALKLMDPQLAELRNTAFQFFAGSPIQRTQLITELEQLDVEELLRIIQELYMDLLRKNLGAHELIKNNDFDFKENPPVLDVLKAIIICERAFYALSQNVHKKLVVYWLSKELP